MPISRRKVVKSSGALATVAMFPGCAIFKGTTTMYGLISKMRTVPGHREAFISILLDGVSGMPGCLSYVVARDSVDSNAIWVTEIWESCESHQTSLTLPSVQEAIAQGRPLIAGFGERFETVPVGGYGLSSPS